MCFSAGASFGAGAVLAVVGTLSIKQVKKKEVLPFAFIPLLFAVQQSIEGCIWLSENHDFFMKHLQEFKYFYLLFAQVLWPFLVPFSIWKMETDPVKKRWIFILFMIGIIASAFYLIAMFVAGAYVEITGFHVYFKVNVEENLLTLANVFYFFATVIPFFVSSKRIWVIGILILFALIFTNIVFPDYVISIWCFFAAWISILIYFFVRK